MSGAAAIVLAGGKSTRMGKDKALIVVQRDKMLAGVICLLSKEFSEIIISASDNLYGELGLKTVPDIYPGRGPLGGIHAGLRASSYDVNFVVACDMPFINTRLAAYMVDAAPGYDIVVPRLGDYYQPLFAVYTKNCLPAIERQLNQGRNKITTFYPGMKTRFVEPEEIEKYGDPNELFFNVNTPVDLEMAKGMAGRKLDGSKV
ncbi:MAG: molybdenum cofactor guanylyltransferase [Eubacteriales bacterium]